MRAAALAVKRRANKVTILDIQSKIDFTETIRAEYREKFTQDYSTIIFRCNTSQEIFITRELTYLYAIQRWGDIETNVDKTKRESTDLII